MIEFVCRDCGIEVCALGISVVPDDERCASCHFIETEVAASERDEMRRLLHCERRSDA